MIPSTDLPALGLEQRAASRIGGESFGTSVIGVNLGREEEERKEEGRGKENLLTREL